MTWLGGNSENALEYVPIDSDGAHATAATALSEEGPNLALTTIDGSGAATAYSAGATGILDARLLTAGSPIMEIAGR